MVSNRTHLLIGTFVLVGVALVGLQNTKQSPNTRQKISPKISLYQSEHSEVARPSKVFPKILSDRDIHLYQKVFASQQETNWYKADKALTQINNPILIGYILADRYLHPKYSSKRKELSAWLDRYADHPQAHLVYNLALRKGASVKDIPSITKPRMLRGYGDSHNLASFANSPHALTWQRALKAWRSGNKLNAAKLFAKMANDENLPSWRISAAAFWSYRAYDAANKKTLAHSYLKIAANEPRSFYGILARKKLGKSLDLTAKPKSLNSREVLWLVSKPAMQRVIALSHLGLSERAGKELRIAFMHYPSRDKIKLVALAHELNLASAQITMSKYLTHGDVTLDYASYPIPSWQPQNGFTIEPALLFALARQESGFRPNAVSRSGALGLMQIMPKTASYIKKRIYGKDKNTVASFIIHDDKNPIHNMALGQGYVRYLMKKPMVEQNLFYMLVAYNAGPSRLMKWKKTIRHNNDPLLFVESIPYTETRSYVMQVMTNYWIYSELAGNSTVSASAVISDQWPRYMASL